MTTSTTRTLSAYQKRVATADAGDLIDLYDRDDAFRSTVTLGRHRFGEGEYRYLADPLPEAVDELRRALYSHLLPIVRDWHTKLSRPTPWRTPSTSGSSSATGPIRPNPPRSATPA